MVVFAGSCLLLLPLVALRRPTLGEKLHTEGSFCFHQVKEDSVSRPHYMGIIDTVLRVEVRRPYQSRSNLDV